jgi:hypothetical protein
MSGKHKKTLQAVFARPTPANVNWADVESLLVALGAAISEGEGSRMRVLLNDRVAVFHRPHPEKETGRAQLRSVRRFLGEAGATPEMT